MTHEVKSGRAMVVPVKASELMREREKELLRQGVTASGKKVEAKRTQSWCRETVSKTGLINRTGNRHR